MTVISGIVGAVAGKKGADAQVDASRDAARVAREIFDIQREDAQPWQQSGQNALAALNFEMGLAERPTFGGAFSNDNALTIDTIRSMSPQYEDQPWIGDENEWWGVPRREFTDPGVESLSYRVGDRAFGTMADAQAFVNQQRQQNPGTAYRGFEATPGYAFRVGEGTKAIERSAAARGGLNSGATMKALGKFGQDIAADEYGNYLNRLGALSGVGQVANQQVAGAAQNYSATAGNALMAGGAARASGYKAIGQGANNALSGFRMAAGYKLGGGSFTNAFGG